MAAATASCAVASTTVVARASRGSPGLGVSCRCVAPAGGAGAQVARGRGRRFDAVLLEDTQGLAYVVGSPTVGPDATTEGSSPGTSEMISVTTGAGQAATARRPPLIADRCLRTQLISAIGAPLRSSAAPTRRSSSGPTPSAGSASSADPPPETRHSTRSSAVSPPTCATMRAAAALPASSGTGWAASTTSMRAQSTL